MAAKSKLNKRAIQSASYPESDVDGGRNCLLLALRSTGSGLGVLSVEGDAYTDMMVSDPEYRAMNVEILKSMFAQMAIDKMCAALAEQARNKIVAALVASNDSSVMDALKKSVDFNLIPLMGPINIDYLNALRY